MRNNAWVALAIVGIIVAFAIGLFSARWLLLSTAIDGITSSASGLELITSNGRDELSIVRGTSVNEGQVIKRLASGLIGWADDNTTTITGAGVVALDLGNDDVNESDVLATIATTGSDPNSIFTEATPDELLINIGANWPTSDAADALSTNGTNCLAGEAAQGIDTIGNAEGCFTPAGGSAPDAKENNVVVVSGATAFDFQNPFDVAVDGTEANVSLDTTELPTATWGDGTAFSWTLTSALDTILNLTADTNNDSATDNPELHFRQDGGATHLRQRFNSVDDFLIEMVTGGRHIELSTLAAGMDINLNAGDDIALTAIDDMSIDGADVFLIADGLGVINFLLGTVQYSFTATQADWLGNILANPGGISGATGTYDFGGADVLEIPNGTAPTVAVTGSMAVDTTDDQLIVHTGTEARVYPSVIERSFALESPVDADRLLLKNYFTYGVTVTDIKCIVDPADAAESVVIALYESDASGDFTSLAANGLDGATTITCDNDGAEDDGALSNGSIDAGDWIGIDVGTVTGTVTWLTVTWVEKAVRE